MAQGGGFLVSPAVIGGVAQYFGLPVGLSVLYVIGAIASLASLRAIARS